jgi:hypothetical protein
MITEWYMVTALDFGFLWLTMIQIRIPNIMKTATHTTSKTEMSPFQPCVRYAAAGVMSKASVAKVDIYLLLNYYIL